MRTQPATVRAGNTRVPVCGRELRDGAPTRRWGSGGLKTAAILDGRLEQQTSLRPTEVMSDTAGASDVVFGLRSAAAPEDVVRLWPLEHKHINFLGKYSFALADPVARGELWPLRDPAESLALA